MTKYFSLDIETDGLNPWYGNRITAIGMHFFNDLSAKTETIILTSKDESLMLGEFSKIVLNNKKAILSGKWKMITKYGSMFDIPFIIARGCLKSSTCIEALETLLKIRHYDLDLIADRVSLEKMSILLNCSSKSGNGLNAIKLWKEGNIKELKSYLKQDLIVTKEVFLKLKKLGVNTEKLLVN